MGLGRWISDLVGTKLTKFSVGQAKFDSAGLAANRTLTIPDKSGTMAMLDDISGASQQIFIQETQPTLVSGQPFIWYQTDADGIVQTMHIFDGVI